jgi:hypothetical protein
MVFPSIELPSSDLISPRCQLHCTAAFAQFEWDYLGAQIHEVVCALLGLGQLVIRPPEGGGLGDLAHQAAGDAGGDHLALSD